MRLIEAFKQTNYQLAGHGHRNVDVLKQALGHVSSELESDIYGTGMVIDNFERKMAEFLGKEKAVFFPSGTMAQQIALRVWCDQKGLKRVAYHPLCHLEIHEEGGLKELHHIEPILLADKDSVIQLEDIVDLKENISCLLLELPQREIGGQLPDFKTLVEISSYCREKGVRLHLDGARLYEVLPYYQKSATEICALFDSIYISFYKGIGGVAGAILAGENSFIEESKVWKRRYGGDLISLYPYIIAADYYFDQRINKMEQYYEDAKLVASLFNRCHAITTIPAVPVSNMFHVIFHAPIEQVLPILVELYQETGIGLMGNLRTKTDQTCYSEISLGDQYSQIPKEKLGNVIQLLDKKMQGTR